MQDSAASHPICFLQANAHGIGVCVGCEDLRWRSHSVSLPWMAAPFFPMTEGGK
jgi:hypothetical protein